MKALRLVFLFAVYTALGFTAHGQAAQFKATWTNNFSAGSVCASGVTANCILGTIVTGTPSGGSAATLCTGAGTATACSAALPSGWSVFAIWTVTAQVQYYGAAGTILTTSTINAAAGGNQASVQNLVVLAPTALAPSVQ